MIEIRVTGRVPGIGDILENLQDSLETCHITPLENLSFLLRVTHFKQSG